MQLKSVVCLRDAWWNDKNTWNQKSGCILQLVAMECDHVRYLILQWHEIFEVSALVSTLWWSTNFQRLLIIWWLVKAEYQTVPRNYIVMFNSNRFELLLSFHLTSFECRSTIQHATFATRGCAGHRSQRTSTCSRSKKPISMQLIITLRTRLLQQLQSVCASVKSISHRCLYRMCIAHCAKMRLL